MALTTAARAACPRAIIQFNKGADGCVLEGFELSGAHNESFNGAGVRINQANDVTIRDCAIHDNDMGIMSNGDGTDATGKNQLIESCLIYSNGNAKHSGYNHNLYLGGTSVRIVACEIHSSLTGHNLKSRAHLTIVLNCYISRLGQPRARSGRCQGRHRPPRQRCGAGGKRSR